MVPCIPTGENAGGVGGLAARGSALGGASTPPLALAELAATLARIGGFEPRPLVAVAVSGGPDSLALAILADRWARREGGAAWALIVDHRLRPESAQETTIVAQWLERRGIAHAVLVRHGGTIRTGIQEAARDARYRLLADWCVGQGCLHLLVAHQREDQAETALIRRRAGSGVDGLAGMSAVRELNGVRLVRPLLGVAKARLIALLDAERQDYLVDPSNRNPAFERSRLRLSGEQAALDAASSQLGRDAACRMQRESALAALLARASSLHPAGFALVEPAPLLAAGEIGERALARLAAVVGGARYPARRERLARLAHSLRTAPNRARTLGGCRFVPWRGRLLVIRETARAAPPLRLAPGGAGVWDGRFLARLPAVVAEPLTVGALGQSGLAPPRPEAAGAPEMPPLLYGALPAAWDGKLLIAVPHLGYARPAAGAAPIFAFRPAVSLVGAGFTVV